jgi:1-deoxy-D-xylulose 5-phosphate reductoisomerase
MGAKITIDSASMMNKGLELIEAVWLFDVNPKDVDIVVHRQSIVHSLIEFVDNSVIAQLGVPDMRIPIQYALTYPQRFESPVKQLRLEEWQTLTFDKPDYDTFECINLCRNAIELGGLCTAAVNSANEMANELEVLLTNKTNENSSDFASLDDVETLYEEAYDLYEQGDLETSLELLEKLLDFDDKNSEALALVGLIYYHSGFFPKAVEYYRKAIKINKNGEMVKQLKMRIS